MTRSVLLTIGLLTSFTLSAQLELVGLWEGTLTLGQSMKGYPMAVYLEKSGTKITGRVYIHVNESRIVETEVSGIMYSDFSIYLDEISFVDRKDDGYSPPFLRKFQLLWKRGINVSSLNGHWQENRKEVFHERRERGRVYLKRVTDNKA